MLAIRGCKNMAGGPNLALDEEYWPVNLPNISALAVWLLSVGTLLIHAVRSRKTCQLHQHWLAAERDALPVVPASKP